MSTQTVEPGTIEHLDESLEKSYPCDIKECLSNHRLNATWFLTHTGSESGCAWMICLVCANNLKRVLAKCDAKFKGMTHCKGCKKNLKVTSIILRPI